MAKLHSYYVLCPLIDQKSFLGVSQDKDSENVIVSLGKNVVNTYRVSLSLMLFVNNFYNVTINCNIMQ